MHVGVGAAVTMEPPMQHTLFDRPDRPRNLRVLLQFDAEVDAWVGVVVELDVAAQAPSLAQALELAREAAQLHVDEKLRRHEDPVEAPEPEAATSAEEVLRHGAPMALDDIDTAGRRDPAVRAVGFVQVDGTRVFHRDVPERRAAPSPMFFDRVAQG
jgi:predicted RNase H-like HicB family nuclease